MHYHAVHFYKDDSSLAATVAEFLAEGIGFGQPGLVIATPEHAAFIRRELGRSGLDVGSLRMSGRLAFMDAREMLASFTVGHMLSPLLFKTRVVETLERLGKGRKPCPIRAYGEMVNLLWQHGKTDQAIALEILWNQLARIYDFSLLCGYASRGFQIGGADPGYRHVCAQHTHVLPLSN